MDNLSLEYEGKDIQPESGEWNEIIESEIYPYYPEDDLIEAVNLAIQLNRPLLLEGEPGCGKSRLAHAIVYEFSQKYPEINWRFRFWNVQSTSKAQDGFYSYDYIGRLQAAQLQNLSLPTERNPQKLDDFVEYGAVGYAFIQHDCRTVVLIDEIDKADTDFPNDLLLAIEANKFEIKEIAERKNQEAEEKRWKYANRNAPPIIIITSNHEKDLPDAFLRRCLYHYIDFPKPSKLIDILNGRFKNPPQELVKKAVNQFLELREEMEDSKGDIGKKVSTSELIDWFTILNSYPPDKAIEKLEAGYPFKSTLLKTREDYNDYSD